MVVKILTVVGARPNFVKLAALERAFRSQPEVAFRVVHTGQHYDDTLNDIFFRQLAIPQPDHFLGVGSAAPARQLARMLNRLDPVLRREKPDLVLVAGDTTSALAGALAGSKSGIPVAHVEAGLRSGDRRMPEEINRILTDAVSDFLFVTEQAGLDNLRREGIAEERIFFTGNCMIDTLVRFREAATRTRAAEKLGLLPGKFVLATLHRPANVDTARGLEAVINLIAAVCREYPLVLPLHPRAGKNLDKHGLLAGLPTRHNLFLIEPQGYLEFLNLLENAALVLTDSGGIQDESTFLGKPCLTLRTTTERPVTVISGTNELAALDDQALILNKIRQAMSGEWKTGTVPPGWDGQSARRISEIITKNLPGNG